MESKRYLVTHVKHGNDMRWVKGAGVYFGTVIADGHAMRVHMVQAYLVGKASSSESHTPTIIAEGLAQNYPKNYFIPFPPRYRPSFPHSDTWHA